MAFDEADARRSLQRDAGHRARRTTWQRSAESHRSGRTFLAWEGVAAFARSPATRSKPLLPQVKNVSVTMITIGRKVL
jgi:hypothetical protein